MSLQLFELGILVVSFSGIARMFISLTAKRKLLRVLGEADRGIFSAGEIADRLNMSQGSVSAALGILERRSLVVSGVLLPAQLQIYRVTRYGKDFLATGSIR